MLDLEKKTILIGNILYNNRNRGGSDEIPLKDTESEVEKKLTLSSNKSFIPKVKVPSFDIIGMLNTFIEIEKLQAMRKILTSKTVDLQKLRYLGEKSTIEEDDE